MLKKEREREIINILKMQNGFITVRELCEALYASESSIRRELTVLEGRGFIKRAYGGAELVTNFSDAISFGKRAYHNIKEKRIIAKKAARLIKDGDVIFMDQSSSAFYLANEIVERTNLTVITNNIEILSILSKGACKVVASGGFLSAENRSCLIGGDAQSVFENTYADILFFSAKSLSGDGIISDCTREEVVLRNSMLKNAAQKVFLCDSAKFDTRSAYKQCGLDEIDYLVSDNETAQKFRSCSKSLTIL